MYIHTYMYIYIYTYTYLSMHISKPVKVMYIHLIIADITPASFRSDFIQFATVKSSFFLDLPS